MAAPPPPPPPPLRSAAPDWRRRWASSPGGAVLACIVCMQCMWNVRHPTSALRHRAAAWRLITLLAHLTQPLPAPAIDESRPLVLASLSHAPNAAHGRMVCGQHSTSRTHTHLRFHDANSECGGDGRSAANVGTAASGAASPSRQPHAGLTPQVGAVAARPPPEQRVTPACLQPLALGL